MPTMRETIYKNRVAVGMVFHPMCDADPFWWSLRVDEGIYAEGPGNDREHAIERLQEVIQEWEAKNE